MIKNDEPIQSPEDDALDRRDFAATIADGIRRLDATQGAVVGILGPWGSGKTSLINLIRIELDESPEIPVLDFNPWMFSGTDQLLESFFTEIAAQLRLKKGKFESIAKELDRYGEKLAPFRSLPFVGQWVGLASSSTKALANLVERRKGGIGETRKLLEEKLAELGTTIVVAIDDVDRLQTSEIRDIFRLIRLTANFPNIVYLVAFDRIRVEEALGEDNLSGRDYLEKIVQVIHNMPAIPTGVLTGQILSALNATLEDIKSPGKLDRDRWGDVLVEIIRPLIRNMRDVRRYASSVHGTIQSLDGKVELVDLLGLEAVRILLPDLFIAVVAGQEALTTPPSSSFHATGKDPQLQAQIDALRPAAGEKPDIATALIERLFPAALGYIKNQSYGSDWQRRWMRERRVAHPDVLRLYLERVAGAGLQGFWAAESALGHLTSREQFDAHIRSLDPTQWQDFIEALDVFEDDFSLEAVVPTSIVLLNLMHEIPERPRGFFDLEPTRIVMGVVYRLLRRLTTREAIEQAVHQILPELNSLSSKDELIGYVGRGKEDDQGLMSVSASHELMLSLGDEIRRASSDELAKEPNLFRLLFMVKQTADSSELQFDTAVLVDLAKEILKTSLSEVRSTGDNTTVHRVRNRMSWNSLLELAGSEEVIQQLISASELQAREDAILADAIALAKEHLAGKPEHTFE
ncbi:MAG: hypothetical protein QOF01_838 [Thermomicrobiales bacterium]|nr:hypothetical protein [Thermomicrobiales bacterium]